MRFRTLGKLRRDRRARRVNWHRRFAWLPMIDTKTDTIFWLEFVWYRVRARGVAEVRGGRHAPEVAQEAPK